MIAAMRKADFASTRASSATTQPLPIQNFYLLESGRGPDTRRRSGDGIQKTVSPTQGFYSKRRHEV